MLAISSSPIHYPETHSTVKEFKTNLIAINSPIHMNDAILSGAFHTVIQRYCRPTRSAAGPDVLSARLSL